MISLRCRFRHYGYYFRLLFDELPLFRHYARRRFAPPALRQLPLLSMPLFSPLLFRRRRHILRYAIYFAAAIDTPPLPLLRRHFIISFSLMFFAILLCYFHLRHYATLFRRR